MFFAWIISVANMGVTKARSKLLFLFANSVNATGPLRVKLCSFLFIHRMWWSFCRLNQFLLAPSRQSWLMRHVWLNLSFPGRKMEVQVFYKIIGMHRVARDWKKMLLLLRSCLLWKHSCRWLQGIGRNETSDNSGFHSTPYVIKTKSSPRQLPAIIAADGRCLLPGLCFLCGSIKRCFTIAPWF